MIPVKVVKQEGQSAVVQVVLGDQVARRIVKSDDIQDGQIPEEVFDAAPLWGDAFDDIAQKVVEEVLGEEWLGEQVQKLLNNNGIWTLEDFQARRAEMRTMIIGLMGLFVMPFQQAITKEIAERENG